MDCIILDIDGTLWDTTPTVADAWNEALKGRTDVAWRATPDNLKKLFGKPMWAIAAEAFPELPQEEQMKLMDLCCENEEEVLKKRPGTVFEGVVETIRELSKKYKVCIVSNCQAGYIEVFLSATGYSGYFKGHLCPGDTGRAKAENIMQICREYHLK